MKEITIKGKTFTEEEICDYGTKSIQKKKKVLKTIGLISIAFYIFSMSIMCLSILTSDPESKEIIIGILATYFVYIGLPGIILILISISVGKKDPYTVGLEYLKDHFPYPVGFNGNIATLLQGDKTIILSEKPKAKLIVSSNDRTFQIFCDNKYSNFFTAQDILEYQILIDNQVVVTSKTQTSNGAGKALAGGLLFGGAGMIAGAIAGNSSSVTMSSQQEIKQYVLLLKVNDIDNPAFVIKLDSLQIASEVVTTLQIICQNDTPSESEEEIVADNQIDKFEEIKKYKELLDMGIISHEEFATRKKNILK